MHQEAIDSRCPIDNPPKLSVAVRTLLRGGFLLGEVTRHPGYALLMVQRADEFGVAHCYCFALAEAPLGTTQIEAAQIASRYHNAKLIIIGQSESDVPTVTWDRFLNLFGGAVFSTSPLEPDFADQLVSLGHNQLPDGLYGRPDDLFEVYVQVALEFIFGTRVIRYGQERRFEARPDGVILLHHNFSALYDAKAYQEGYPVTLETIRQFDSYVKEFTYRYSSYLPRLNAFVVLSGTFPHQEQTLVTRSQDLFAVCGVPLVFLTADSLAHIVQLFATYPAARRAINWPRIFANPHVLPQYVHKEIEAIKRDGIIPRL